MTSINENLSTDMSSVLIFRADKTVLYILFSFVVALSIRTHLSSMHNVVEGCAILWTNSVPQRRFDL